MHYLLLVNLFIKETFVLFIENFHLQVHCYIFFFPSVWIDCSVPLQSMLKSHQVVFVKLESTLGDACHRSVAYQISSAWLSGFHHFLWWHPYGLAGLALSKWLLSVICKYRFGNWLLFLVFSVFYNCHCRTSHLQGFPHLPCPYNQDGTTHHLGKSY